MHLILPLLILHEGCFAAETTSKPAQKIEQFNKTVAYLQKARNCLSGKGCSKSQSYFANYSLGAAVGFARTSFFSSLPPTREARANGAILALLVQDLGYRYLVVDSVHLFRCLTLRGCDEQTKRYIFYNLGISSGEMGYLGYRLALNRVQENFFITIEDPSVKKELHLNSARNTFMWYEILGFSTPPTQNEAQKKFRKLSLIYHPDRTKKEEELAGKVIRILSLAKDKGGL